MYVTNRTQTENVSHVWMFVCVDLESSGLEPSRFSKCSSCKFGAECDEDSEGIWLVNIWFVFVYYRAQVPKHFVGQIPWCQIFIWNYMFTGKYPIFNIHISINSHCDFPFMKSYYRDKHASNMNFLCRCVCNIDCSGYNMNPVCGSDGQSYSNPCQIREASCLKQSQIDVKYLGQCPGKHTHVHKQITHQ